jgi:hypothetical protein
MDILIMINISGAILISIINADFRSRSLSDSFFLLTVAGASNDTIKVVIEISIEVAVFFVIKGFFVLIFDFLEIGNASEIKI